MRTIHRDIVGAFIFSKDSKILLGKSIKGGVYQDAWIVPGGGIEEGESKFDALKREMLEEVGINVEHATLEHIPGDSSGKSEKVLKPSGERVVVEMIFHDYTVHLNQDADEVTLLLDDDLAEAEWFTINQITGIELGGATKHTLKKIGWLKRDDSA